MARLFSVVVCINPNTTFSPPSVMQGNYHLLTHQILAINKNTYQFMLTNIPLFKFFEALLRCFYEFGTHRRFAQSKTFFKVI